MAAVWRCFKQRGCDLEQHYFASYHGSGPADAVASFLKKRFHNIRANYRHNSQSVSEMASLCATIANTTLSEEVLMPVDLQTEECRVKN